MNPEELYILCGACLLGLAMLAICLYAWEF